MEYNKARILSDNEVRYNSLKQQINDTISLYKFVLQTMLGWMMTMQGNIIWLNEEQIIKQTIKNLWEHKKISFPSWNYEDYKIQMIPEISKFRSTIKELNESIDAMSKMIDSIDIFIQKWNTYNDTYKKYLEVYEYNLEDITQEKKEDIINAKKRLDEKKWNTNSKILDILSQSKKK